MPPVATDFAKLEREIKALAKDAAGAYTAEKNTVLAYLKTKRENLRLPDFPASGDLKNQSAIDTFKKKFGDFHLELQSKALGKKLDDLTEGADSRTTKSARFENTFKKCATLDRKLASV